MISALLQRRPGGRGPARSIAWSPGRPAVVLSCLLALLLAATLAPASSQAESPPPAPQNGGAPLVPPASPPNQQQHPKPGAGSISRDPQLAPWRAHESAPRPPTTVIAHNWTNEFPDLYAVSAVSAGDAWAAGEYGHLLHFSGNTWQEIDPPNLQGIDLWDIKMLSTTDGWIPAGAQAFEYDGTRWNARSNGLGADPGARLGLVAPLGAADVWGIGRTAGRDTLLHWDGTVWSTRGPVLTNTVSLYDIAMSGGGNGWAVGEEALGGAYVPVVLHYDGTTWTRLPGPPGGSSVFSVWAGQPGDAWMVGTGPQTGQIYHYAGGSGTWSTWTPPDNSQPFRVFMLGPGEGWVTTDKSILHWDGAAWTAEYAFAGTVLQGVTGVAGQIWAVGGLDTVLTRIDSGPWLAQRGGPTTSDLYGVATLSPTNAWAVGASGTVLHYTGITWQATPTAITGNLYAIQMLSAGEGTAVGGDLASGVIAHWDGSQWTAVATPPAALYGLALLGNGAGWAVGQGGAIWEEVEGVWIAVPSPTGSTLNSVVMDSPTHGWAVGGGFLQDTAQPILLEYTASRWVDRTASLPPGAPGLFAAVLAPDGAEGWAVGNRAGASPILHLRGGSWTLDPAASVVDLHGVAPEALGEAWAVGCNAYHYFGGAWQVQSFPTNAGYCLNGLALLPGQGGWAVGYAGKILHYTPLAPGQRFYDVPLTNPFYTYINNIALRGIISGYNDNTFRPFNNITRGQLAKMVVIGAGWPLVTPITPTFADVPADAPFYSFIETAAAQNLVSGYTCGGPAEPCDPLSRAYFRPASDVTRGQLAKIVVGAKGWGPANPPTPPFADVPSSNPFYGTIAQAAQKGIISGYACGGPGEPCPGVYFRSGASATRAQLSKILYLALNQP